MTLLNRLLALLDGRKTFIGLAALAVYYGGLSLNLWNADPTIEGLIYAWTGVGLVHKVVKG